MKAPRATQWAGQLLAVIVGVVILLYVIGRLAGDDPGFTHSTVPPPDGATTTSPTTPPATTTTLPLTGECAVGNALAAVGDTERAERAYQSVLHTNPISECAAAGLIALNAVIQPPVSTPDPCVVGSRLHKAGASDEARDVLVDAVKKGNSDCAPTALHHALEPSLADRAAAIVTEIGKWLPLLALFVLAALVISIPFSQRRLGTIRRLRQPTLVFESFKDPATDPKPGAAVTALTAAAYHHSGSADSSLRLVDAHFELSSFATDLEKIVPQLAPATTLVRFAERLVASPQLNVSGQMHAAGRSGPGLTIRMADRGGVIGIDTVRTAAVPPGTTVTEDSFNDLGILAGAWTRHQSARYLEQDAETMTTSSSLSFAWLVTGQAYSSRGDSAAAIHCYRQAVEADGTHLRARTQLALAIAETDAQYETIVHALTEALEALKAAGV